MSPRPRATAPGGGAASTGCTRWRSPTATSPISCSGRTGVSGERRRSRVRFRRRAGACVARAQGEGDGSRGAVLRPLGAARDALRRGGDGDARASALGSGASGQGDPRGEVARAAARHPLRRKGLTHGRRLSHHLGCRSLRATVDRSGRHRGREAQSRRGSVSRHGAMALAWTMDKLGPLARTAADCALVLATIAGPDPLDPSAVTQPFNVPAVTAKRRRKLKIGVLKGATDRIQVEVAKNFTDALAVLHDVIDVVPDVTLPDLPWGVVGGTIIAAEGSSAFDDLLDSGRVAWLTAAEDRIGGYGALAIPARDYLRALRVRRLMGKAFDDYIKQFDAIAVPTRNSVASPVEKSFREAWPDVTGGASLIGPANVVGAPAISLPNGFGVAGPPPRTALPTRAFDEGVLVQLGRVYQARTDWHKRTPAIA